MFLILILLLSFFICSIANAADISEGRKLYPNSEKIYFLSYWIPDIFTSNLSSIFSDSLKVAEDLPQPLSNLAF